ncbi:hypothetical protein ILYODFUR_011951, partial [Ilyodon furcidens]
LHPRKADEDTFTQRKLHTQPRSKHPCRILPPTTQHTATAREGPHAIPPPPPPTDATGQTQLGTMPTMKHRNGKRNGIPLFLRDAGENQSNLRKRSATFSS